MTLVVNFLTIIAWIAAVLGWALFGLRVYGGLAYTELERAMDGVRGITRTWPVKVPFCVAAVATAFLVAKAMS